MSASTSTRNALVGKVHLAKKQLGLGDDEYRALLLGATGKESCKDLGVAQLSDVLNRFVALGFQPAAGRAPQDGKKRAGYIEIPDSDPLAAQKRYALGLAGMLGWSPKSLNKRLEKQFQVSDIRWLKDQAALQTLIKDMCNRCRRRGLDPTPRRP